MFFGFNDTRQMTQLFHSANIDELMEVDGEGSRRKVRKQVGVDQPSTADPMRANARSSRKPRSVEAQHSVDHR